MRRLQRLQPGRCVRAARGVIRQGLGSLTAVALLSDGSGWIDRVEVLVTLAACIEES